MQGTIQHISNVVFSIKDKISDGEFKDILDNLMKLHQVEDEDQKMINLYYKTFWFHSHKNNYCFHYCYNLKNNTLTTIHENNIQTFAVGNEITYELEYHYDTKETIDHKAKITKITPKYVHLEVNNCHQKHSNTTFCKLVNYCYVNIY
jgi:hypothetical protein